MESDSTGSEMDHELRITLVQAIKEKYCTTPKPYYDPDVLHSSREIKVIATSKTPGAIPIEEVKTIILESSNISSTGPVDELKAMCRSVTEIHIGGNTIDNWETVLSIINSVPKLKYLDLNRNVSLSTPPPLLSPPSAATALPLPLQSSLSVLILSCSQVPFINIANVLQYLPSVTELHLSKNEYEDKDLLQLDVNGVGPPGPPHRGLKMLHLVSNNVKEWESVRHVGRMFPSLETLLMSHNPIDNIVPTGECFTNLKTLNLNNTNVSSWDSLEGLLTFPDLKSLSLWHVPIGSDLNEKEKRFAIISRLPGIEQLNKSHISETEREDAERWLVRQYQQKPKRPSVYDDLTKKHGSLDPLPNIDLSPKTKFSLEFIFKDFDRRSEVRTISTQQTVKEFKIWIANSLLQCRYPLSKLTIVYVDLEEGKVYESQVMKPDTKQLYRFKMKDGDKIEIFLND